MDLSKIGRYEIKNLLGKGGMASVYRAFDPMFERDVAVKVLPRDLLHEQDFYERFRREAKLIAGLENQAIVPVYDFGEQDDQPYIVMRLMAGGSLANRLERGPFSLSRASAILTRLAAALDRAHARGIIHRDLKPANFLLDEDSDPYIADFGIAKLLTGGGTHQRTVIMGTPAYMSPEQWSDDPLDRRCDVYALGVILFEMVTGQLPYQASSAPALMNKHINAPIPRIHPLRSSIQPVLDRTLAKNREDRYATAGELAQDLAEIVRKETAPAPRAPHVVVWPPIIAKPTDLGFERSGLMGQLIGWFNGAFYVAGVSTSYQFQLLPRAEEGHGTCVFMHHPNAEDTDFGSLMQRCPAEHLAGRRLRFEGELATQDLTQWAGLWLRAESEDKKTLIFENMSDRPVRGTTGWQRYAIETDLPAETKWLNYGVVLSGRGFLWADNFRLTFLDEYGNWRDLDQFA
ncbi:MAG TPA: serine/threonine-protein kinase [Blastocatellia bacterium]|nr:serine/threonine-protein kinase [Blastocatellia bacterium]HMY75621.1 serine/threonine-protein kinase [Blastocatellia bacterium]HMZ19160.1 serine/threonine-protein kinase [Blastocatellia bacterium]HNG30444.1 serine/threonine-protein kinase [Blastocatellia bacterium]